MLLIIYIRKSILKYQGNNKNTIKTKKNNKTIRLMKNNTRKFSKALIHLKLILKLKLNQKKRKKKENILGI